MENLTMKKTVTTMLYGFGAVALLASGFAFAATIPADKAEMKISEIPGDQPATPFAHAKHATTYKGAGGKAITCKDCHHELKTPDGGTAKVEACSVCHVKPDQAQKTVDGKPAPFLYTLKDGKAEMKSILYHQQCKDGCHKQVKVEGKNLTACKTCHPK